MKSKQLERLYSFNLKHLLRALWRKIALNKLEIAIFLFFTAIGLVYWWPLPLHLATHQQEPLMKDSAFNAWILAWGSHALLHYPWRFFEANMFYPFAHTLAWGDNLFGITIFAFPFIYLFGVLATYNLVLIFSTILSAWTLYKLVKYIGRNIPAAIIAGVIWAVSYARFAEGHLQILAMQWIPLTFLYAEKMRKEYKRKHLYLFSFFTFLTLATNLYLSVYLVLSFCIYTAVLAFRRSANKAYLKHLAVGWLIAAVFALPLYLPSIIINIKRPVARSFGEQISLPVNSLFKFPPGHFFNDLLGKVRVHSTAISFILLLLIAAALIYFLAARKRSKQKTTLAIAFFAVGFFGLLSSLGPSVRLINGKVLLKTNYFFTIPYRLMPGYKSMRVPARWYFIGIFGLAVVAGLFLSDILPKFRLRWQYLMAALVSCLLLLEQSPSPIPLYAAEKITDHPAYEWLAKQPGEFPILELPIFPGVYYKNNDTIEGRRLYLSTYHWKKRVSGAFSPVIPRKYSVQAGSLNALGDNPDAVKLLRDWKVKYVLFVPQDYKDLGWEKDIPATLERLNHTQGIAKVEEFSDATVYRVD